MIVTNHATKIAFTTPTYFRVKQQNCWKLHSNGFLSTKTRPKNPSTDKNYTATSSVIIWAKRYSTSGLLTDHNVDRTIKQTCQQAKIRRFSSERRRNLPVLIGSTVRRFCTLFARIYSLRKANFQLTPDPYLRPLPRAVEFTRFRRSGDPQKGRPNHTSESNKNFN